MAEDGKTTKYRKTCEEKKMAEDEWNDNWWPYFQRAKDASYYVVNETTRIRWAYFPGEGGYKPYYSEVWRLQSNEQKLLSKDHPDWWKYWEESTYGSFRTFEEMMSGTEMLVYPERFVG
jgi:hypothetical protein